MYRETVNLSQFPHLMLRRQTQESGFRWSRLPTDNLLRSPETDVCHIRLPLEHKQVQWTPKKCIFWICQHLSKHSKWPWPCHHWYHPSTPGHADIVCMHWVQLYLLYFVKLERSLFHNIFLVCTIHNWQGPPRHTCWYKLGRGILQEWLLLSCAS